MKKLKKKITLQIEVKYQCDEYPDVDCENGHALGQILVLSHVTDGAFLERERERERETKCSSRTLY